MMTKHAKVTVGILYIFWMLAAWSFVGLYRFYFSSHLLTQDPIISTIAKEAIRFFVFMGPIIIFIMINITKQWYRWLGLYGCKKGAILKTISLTFLYALLGIGINVHVFHKSAHLLSISPFFWFTAFSLSIIMEEIAFRGFLFYLFEEWNKKLIVLVTTLAFAAKHVPGWLLFPAELSPLGLMGDFSMVFYCRNNLRLSLFSNAFCLGNVSGS